MKQSSIANRAKRKTPKVPKTLKPLAEEIRKHSSYQKLLPKAVKHSEILEIQVFGSSVKGSSYKDIDVALFLNPGHPTFRTIDRIYNRKVGRIEYHVFPDNEEGRAVFDAMLDLKTPDGRGASIRLPSLADFYTIASQG